MKNLKMDIKLSKKELSKRQYEKKRREIQIARIRASVVRKQIVKAYEVLENIRFDFVSDTMFRDYIVVAKRQLEGALGDFLMDDTYWKEKKDKHRKMTPKEYDEHLKTTPTKEKSKAK